MYNTVVITAIYTAPQSVRRVDCLRLYPLLDQWISRSSYSSRPRGLGQQGTEREPCFLYLNGPNSTNCPAPKDSTFVNLICVTLPASFARNNAITFPASRAHIISKKEFGLNGCRVSRVARNLLCLSVLLIVSCRSQSNMNGEIESSQFVRPPIGDGATYRSQHVANGRREQHGRRERARRQRRPHGHRMLQEPRAQHAARAAAAGRRRRRRQSPSSQAVGSRSRRRRLHRRRHGPTHLQSGHQRRRSPTHATL